VAFRKPRAIRRESWDVVQPTHPSTVAGRDHPATRAAGLGRLRYLCQPQAHRQSAAAVCPGHMEHVHARHIEQGVDARSNCQAPPNTS
jgi:hypothetical protein